jgi:excisionase family DNA binding protein
MKTERVERLYNVKAVVDILGSPRVTVIRWIREGRLRAFKVPGGRLWRIKESDLAAFINSGKGRVQ